MPCSNPRRRGVSVRLFLTEEYRLLEISNWTGIAAMCSRAKYPENRDREEFGRPGVYVLVGPSQSDTGR